MREIRAYHSSAFSPRPGAVCLCVIILIVFTGSAEGQYFGRNKINYEHFDFEVLRTGHFEVYHYPAEKRAAVDAGVMLERWYSRLVTIFGSNLEIPQPVII